MNYRDSFRCKTRFLGVLSHNTSLSKTEIRSSKGPDVVKRRAWTPEGDPVVGWHEDIQRNSYFLNLNRFGRRRARDSRTTLQEFLPCFATKACREKGFVCLRRIRSSCGESMCIMAFYESTQAFGAKLRLQARTNEARNEGLATRNGHVCSYNLKLSLAYGHWLVSGAAR